MTSPNARSTVVVFPNLGPYHIARLEAAARHFSGAGERLVSLEIARTDGRHYWGAGEGDFERAALEPDIDYRRLGHRAIASRVFAWLEAQAPDVVVANGWAAPEALAAIRWAWRRGRAVVVISTAHRGSIGGGRAAAGWRRFVLAGCDAALVGGVRHRRYLQELGFAPARIFEGYNVVDNAFFAAQVTSARASSTGARRHEFLVPVRLAPEKDLFGLIEAFESYCSAAKEGQRWGLRICGDGPLEVALAERIASSPWCRLIRLDRFQAHHELPAAYAGAGAVVLPSLRESWGLVINEAMAGGVPVIASDACGAIEDLVLCGVTGSRFPAGDRTALALALREMASMPVASRAAMGAAAAEHVASWSPDRFAGALHDAARSAWTRRHAIHPRRVRALGLATAEVLLALR